MKYEKGKKLFFQYYLMEKELINLDNAIKRYERNMPYDNGPASEYVMELMDEVIIKKIAKEKEIEKLKNEIDLILRIFQ